jgi:hypothetical protein
MVAQVLGAADHLAGRLPTLLSDEVAIDIGLAGLAGGEELMEQSLALGQQSLSTQANKKSTER